MTETRSCSRRGVARASVSMCTTEMRAVLTLLSSPTLTWLLLHILHLPRNFRNKRGVWKMEKMLLPTLATRRMASSLGLQSLANANDRVATGQKPPALVRVYTG